MTTTVGTIGWDIETPRGKVAEGRPVMFCTRRVRRACVDAFGSGWSSGWSCIMNAELTAEKRPAYDQNSGGQT
jgi:hypothetical protein